MAGCHCGHPAWGGQQLKLDPESGLALAIDDGRAFTGYFSECRVVDISVWSINDGSIEGIEVIHSKQRAYFFSEVEVLGRPDVFHARGRIAQ